MLNRFKLFLIHFSVVTVLGCATSSSLPPAGEGVQNIYMPSTMYAELKAQIPDYPKAGSAEQAADEAELRKFQKIRTEQDCARAATEVKVTLQNFYGKPYGDLTPSQVEVLKPFFDQIRNDGGAYIGQIKNGYSRQRPYLYIEGLKPCISEETSFAYPSGHATLAALYGLVLMDLFPNQKSRLQRREDQIAQDRVLGGVHHPSDILVGKKLGQILYQEIKKSKAYLDDIEKYKKLLN